MQRGNVSRREGCGINVFSSVFGRFAQQDMKKEALAFMDAHRAVSYLLHQQYITTDCDEECRDADRRARAAMSVDTDPINKFTRTSAKGPRRAAPGSGPRTWP